VSVVVDTQPEGPYYLGGASFGGLVAFEMAQQLHAMGHQVGLLALLDTPGPGAYRLQDARAARDRTRQKLNALWVSYVKAKVGKSLQRLTRKLSHEDPRQARHRS